MTIDSKAPEPDEKPRELLKLLDDNGSHHDTVQITNNWLISNFIALPIKKQSEINTVKSFSKIIHQRLYLLYENPMGTTQFGFRKATGRRETLFSGQILFQRRRDVSCDIRTTCLIGNRLHGETAITRVTVTQMRNKDGKKCCTRWKYECR